MTINTDSVSKQLYMHIKEEICNHGIQPGEKIDTKGIAARYGVSVMPVRDALRHLAQEGLVENRERVGFYVYKCTGNEIHELYEMRTLLEMHCLRKYGEQINEELIEEFMRRLGSETDKRELDKLDEKIHSMFVKASGNQVIISEYENLSAKFSLGILGFRGQNTELAREEHLEILDLVKNKDIDKAIIKLQKHLVRSEREAIEWHIHTGSFE